MRDGRTTNEQGYHLVRWWCHACAYVGWVGWKVGGGTPGGWGGGMGGGFGGGGGGLGGGGMSGRNVGQQRMAINRKKTKRGSASV
jgi:hypothetical protein